MLDEVELKLTLRPQDADTLEATGLMAGTPEKPPMPMWTRPWPHPACAG
jgi:hypothetical protein